MQTNKKGTIPAIPSTISSCTRILSKKKVSCVSEKTLKLRGGSNVMRRACTRFLLQVENVLGSISIIATCACVNPTSNYAPTPTNHWQAAGESYHQTDRGRPCELTDQHVGRTNQARIEHLAAAGAQCNNHSSSWIRGWMAPANQLSCRDQR